MTKHIMIDLETWGTKPYSLIVMIGAVHFDPDKPGVFRDSFEVALDPISSQKAGLRIDADTVSWWMDPKQDEAREHWFKMLKFELPMALDGFSTWLDTFSTIEERCIWGNGSNFDNALLEQAYQVAGRDKPWSYKGDRDFRTIKALDVNRILHPAEGKIVNSGVKHTALYDAFWQAAYMQNIVDQLKLAI